MIDLRTLTMWLATIDENRVADRIKPKLVLYQAECADLLRDHFFGKHAGTGDSLLDECRSLQRAVAALVEQRERQLALERETAALRVAAEAAKASADSALVKAEQAHTLAHVAGATANAALAAVECGHGYFTVLAYARRMGRTMSLQAAQEHGRHLSAMCRAMGVPVQQTPDQRFGRVNAYAEHVLAEYFAPARDS